MLEIEYVSYLMRKKSFTYIKINLTNFYPQNVKYIHRFILSRLETSSGFNDSYVEIQVRQSHILD